MSDKTIDLGHGLSITIEWQEDYDADLSYLQQTDREMGPGFEAEAAQRLDSLERGDWCPMGYIARLMFGDTELYVDSLWGIESDSDPSYIAELEGEAVKHLREWSPSHLSSYHDKLVREAFKMRPIVDLLHLRQQIQWYPDRYTSLENDYWWQFDDTHTDPDTLTDAWTIYEPPTVVIFRVWTREFPGTRKRGTGNLYNIIALFPDDVEYNGLIGSYQHIGQHGAADYQHIIAGSRPATPDEYTDLKCELESAPYHYNLVVRQRRNRK